MKANKKPLWLAFLLIGPLFIPGFARDAKAQEIGAHMAAQWLPEFGETPVGWGLRAGVRTFIPFVGLEAEFNRLPATSSGNLVETQFFLGAKAGVHLGPLGVFVKAAPGVVDFSGGGPIGRLTQGTHFGLALGGGLEYFFIPRVGLRWDLEEVNTYFGNTSLLSLPGRLGVPLGTNANVQTSIGIMLHF